MAYAPAIRVTRRGLLRRRTQIYRDLNTTAEDFSAKVRSVEPLSNAEFSAMEELREIAFLLGEQ